MLVRQFIGQSQNAGDQLWAIMYITIIHFGCEQPDRILVAVDSSAVTPRDLRNQIPLRPWQRPQWPDIFHDFENPLLVACATVHVADVVKVDRER